VVVLGEDMVRVLVANTFSSSPSWVWILVERLRSLDDIIAPIRDAEYFVSLLDGL